MIYIIMFVSTLALLIVVVRVGAVALKLTGMEWDNAWFQALSAFTTAGYTTSSSEKALQDNERRKIISWLMILGNAGFATLLVTLVKGLNTQLNIDFFYQLLYLIAILLLLLLLYFVLSRRVRFKQIMGKVNALIEKYLVDSGKMEKAPWEELFHFMEGYGFARVEIQSGCSCCGKKICDSGLEEHNIMVVAIERISGFVPTPGGERTIEMGDMLVCYGPLESIKTELVDSVAPMKTLDDESADPPRD